MQSHHLSTSKRSMEIDYFLLYYKLHGITYLINLKKQKMELKIVWVVLMTLLLAYSAHGQHIMNFELPQGSQTLSTYRVMVVRNNLKYIENSNANPKNSYKLAPNPQFMALTLAEYSAMYLNKIPQVQSHELNVKFGTLGKDNLHVGSSFPVNVGQVLYRDLRSKHPTVYNQGRCGNCYAYASVQSATINNYVLNRGLPPLSIQQLTQCTTSFNHGCNGGFLVYSLIYMIQTGLDSEANYPLNPLTNQNSQPVVPTCKQTGTRYRIRSAYSISQQFSGLCVGRLSVLWANLTMSTAIYASTNQFMFYESGVLRNVAACVQAGQSGNVDHAVVIVGFRYDGNGSSNGSYFIVKNSYGTGWGAGGYILVSLENNQCNICIRTYYSV